MQTNSGTEVRLRENPVTNKVDVESLRSNGNYETVAGYNEYKTAASFVHRYYKANTEQLSAIYDDYRNDLDG